MRTKKLVVAVVAFLIALLVPSCTPDDLGISHAVSYHADKDAGPTSTVSQNTPGLDASTSDIEDSSRTSEITPDGSAVTDDVAEDASAPDDTFASEDVPPVDPRYTVPQAFLLPPTTCSGQRLTLTPAELDLFDHGYTLWHLCYKTPSPHTSNRTIARLRANEVVLGLFHRGETLDLLHANAPMVANPWTVSVLVALPRNQPPLFTIVNLYQAGQQLANITNRADGTFPDTHGELRAWVVEADGSHTITSVSRACRNPIDSNEHPMPFLPATACPGYERTCPTLSGMDCRSF